MVVKNYSCTNVTLTNSGTAYETVLTERKCLVRVKGESLSTTARVSFTEASNAAGEMIFQGAEWFTPEPLFFGTKSIWLQSPNAGAVYQIVVWEME